MRVAPAEGIKAAVRKPTPEYNPLARQMKIQGEVLVDVHINEKGDVEEVLVVTGNAMLTPNVVKTVKDWKFTPFVQRGKPAAAVTQLSFVFKL